MNATVPDSSFTRCPGCATVFRITAEQLALREGQVRCGHCNAVFDANDYLVAPREPVSDVREVDSEAEEEPAPDDNGESAPADERADESPTSSDADGESAPAHEQTEQSPTIDDADGESESIIEDAGESGAAVGITDAEEYVADENAGEVSTPPAFDRPGHFEWRPRKPLRERPKALYAIAIAILVVALGVQALFEYRDSLAARLPGLRPLLQTACVAAACTVDPPRDAGALSIEASDLRSDPAHGGVLLLTATIRNRAPYAIAWPYLELTLTNASDQVVVRRAFAPPEYLGGSANAQAGLAGNDEQALRLYVDARATAQAGYRLYLFYP